METHSYIFFIISFLLAGITQTLRWYDFRLQMKNLTTLYKTSLRSTGMKVFWNPVIQKCTIPSFSLKKMQSAVASELLVQWKKETYHQFFLKEKRNL